MRLWIRYCLIIVGLTATVAIAIASALMWQIQSSSQAMQESSNEALQAALLGQAENDARALAQYLAANLVNPLYVQDFSAVEDLVGAAAAQDTVTRAAVIDSQGTVVADIDDAALATENLPSSMGRLAEDAAVKEALDTKRLVLKHTGDKIVAAAPIAIGSRMVGISLIEMPLSAADAEAAALQEQLAAINHATRSKLLATTILLLLLLSGLATVFSLYIGRGLARPLVAMTAVMSRLAGGDAKVAIPALQRRDEIGDMARSLSIIRDTGLRALRAQTALNQTASVVFMADRDGQIIYANKAAERYFTAHMREFAEAIPDFAAGNLIGQPLSRLYAAAPQANSNDGFGTARITIGARNVDVAANPVVSESGDRIGTVVEWADCTEKLAMQADVQSLIKAAVAGDLSRRIDTSGKSGFMLRLADGINSWAATVSAAFADVQRLLAALAGGDLTARIANELHGDLRRVREDANGTMDRLSVMVGRTVDGVAAIRSATAQLAAGAADLSERTEEQVASLEEASASIREISATVRQNAQNATIASELAGVTLKAAEAGGGVARDTAAAMGGLVETSTQVASIVDVIEEIAFQTNLLALNAAVEAARAGEAGRGFAVVATEVRSLAQRSAQALKDVRKLIAQSGTQVSRGAALLDKTGATLTEIVTAVKRVTEIVNAIASANQEQTAGIEQVEDAIAQMENLSQRNASLVEESTAALASVNEQAGRLAELVGVFRVDIDDGGLSQQQQPRQPDRLRRAM
ncbi:MAG: methyl-accepting chemotaxis protein [Dongiaceae bacterium]